MIMFGELDSAESKWLAFNFAPDLQKDEVPTSVSLEITVERGTDAAPTLLAVGALQVSGQEVRQLIVGRVPKVQYLLRCRCVGSITGLAHVVRGYLRVV